MSPLGSLGAREARKTPGNHIQIDEANNCRFVIYNSIKAEHPKLAAGWLDLWND